MSLAKSLDQIHRHLTNLWTGTSNRPAGLTYSEYEYLCAIERLDGEQLSNMKDNKSSEEDHGHHLQDLVDILGIKKASASTAIAKLEKKGLVNRFPCQYDARAQHIILTNKASAMLRKEEIIYEALSDKIKETLSPEEFKAFASSLDKICNRL